MLEPTTKVFDLEDEACEYVLKEFNNSLGAQRIKLTPREVRDVISEFCFDRRIHYGQLPDVLQLMFSTARDSDTQGSGSFATQGLIDSINRRND